MVAADLADVGGVSAVGKEVSLDSSWKDIRAYIPCGPMNRIQSAMLRIRHPVTPLQVRVDKSALASLFIHSTGFMTRRETAQRIEKAVVPGRHSHIRVLAVAIKRRNDRSAVRIRFASVPGDKGDAVDDVLDVGV